MTTLRVVSGSEEATVADGRTYVVGRSRDADIVIADGRVSRRHLLIEPAGGGWSVRDISSNGTWVAGERVHHVPVRGEVRFHLGTPTGPEVVISAQAPARRPHELPTLLAGSPEQVPGPRLPHGAEERPTGPEGIPPADGRIEHAARSVHPLLVGTMSIGRSHDNDIVLSDLLVSRHHAELHVEPTSVEIVDLGSANGTFVNGQRVTQTTLHQRDVIAVGHHLFQLEGTTLVESVDSGDAGFEAERLSVWAGKKQLMHDVSFRLPARTLLAVVGPSGAGKSTLLHALTGFRPADVGSVRYAGRDLYAEYDELRRRIGYVPQEDLLHTALTVRKALDYGAELRFPPDVTAAERRSRVEEVLAELGLTAHADTPVARLSGGQRKRTSVALELLTKPSLLYLDEPTSGLDPGLDKSVMMSLRSLADDGRTVIVVTHSVAHLDLCDLVLVLAPGGYVAYLGPPQGALTYFGKKDFPDVFIELEATPGEEAGARFRASDLYVAGSVGAPSARPAPSELPSLRQQSVLAQLSTLSRRLLSVVVADKSYLRLIIAFPFLLGLIPRVIPAPAGLSVLPNEPNRDASTLLLVLTLCACFMGSANAVREIVKERPIYRRERAIGLSMTAYLGSKIAVLTLVTTAQSIVFTLIGLLGRTPKHAVVLGSPLLEALLAVVVTALASAMLGLVISTLVDNADKTMPLLVLVTMTQLVFCGGLVPVAGKPGLEQVSWLAPARWGFAALASGADLNVVSRTDSPDPLWKHTAAVYLTDLGLGLLVGAAAVMLCAYLLRRVDPRPGRRT